MKYKPQEKYDKSNTIFIGLKLNKKTDKYIIDRLNAEPNKQGFIKKILKEYCKNT